MIVAAVLRAGLAHADDVKQYADCGREPTETDVTAAKGAFQAGNASFEEADYSRAIVYWEDAYRRDCTAHGMLLNLARAYELNGNKPQAVVALRTYLERVSSADKDKIERRIDVLNKQIEAERAQAASTAATPPAPVPAPPPSAAVPSPSPEPAREEVKPPLAALVIAGVGGATAIVGGVLFITGQSDLAAADDRCPDRENCQDEKTREEGNSARTRATIGTWLGLGGVAVAGGGLAWYFLSPRTKTAAGRGFTPIAAPNYVGFNYSAAF
jgi:hypothetical protein